jgi:hypothetical protein
MIEVIKLRNGYLVTRGTTADAAMCRHYDEVSHYVTQFLHRESDPQWEICLYFEPEKKASDLSDLRAAVPQACVGEPAAHTSWVTYPCGCKAGPYVCCPRPLPDYCPDHGKPAGRYLGI